MIGVCIGVGEGWVELARRSAATMELMTGLTCHVIATDDFGCCHPSWLKCHIHRIFPEEDSFLVFDADILCVEPWDPQTLFQSTRRPFMAVPEPNANPDLLQECKDWGLGYPNTYINCGLLIFGREHGFILDRAWTHHPHGGRWLEQTAINHALVTEHVETCLLPRHFNMLAQRGRINSIYCRTTLRDAVNIHTCAMDDASACMATHERLEKYIDSGTAGLDRQEFLRSLPQHSTGAEIGVFCGDFSRDILRIVQPATLHLVDLFQGKHTSGNVDGRNMRTVDMAEIYNELTAIGHPIHTWQMDSIEWLRTAPDNLLDWIYLDTTHEYERTLGELRHSMRVVKPGGIIAGHDFSRAFPGVVTAVIEFTKETNLPLQIYDGDLLHTYVIRTAE